MAETQVVRCATTARSKKSVFRRSRLTPLNQLCHWLRQQMTPISPPKYLLHMLLRRPAPAKSVGYPLHLFCCVAAIRKGRLPRHGRASHKK